MIAPQPAPSGRVSSGPRPRAGPRPHLGREALAQGTVTAGCSPASRVPGEPRGVRMPTAAFPLRELVLCFKPPRLLFNHSLKTQSEEELKQRRGGTRAVQTRGRSSKNGAAAAVAPGGVCRQEGAPGPGNH